MGFTGKPQLTTAAPLENNGFWPDLQVGELMTKYRIPAEYADDTIMWGLTLAVVNVNDVLKPVKAKLEADGYPSLADYNSAQPEPVNSIQVTDIHYQHAVYSYAKAFLLKQFNSMNRRQDAENAAKEAPETETDWLNESRAAISKLFAKFLSDDDKPSIDGFHVWLM